MTSPTKAPDGDPWPKPRVACDTSEQNVLAFGHVPAEWTASAPVHYGQLDETPPPLFEPLRYPWHCERANLGEGDYQLLGPDGAPLPKWCAVETKRRDLVSSLTAGHDRLEAEMVRLSAYRFPFLVADVSTERLLGAHGNQPRAAAMKERSLLGVILAFANDYRIPFVLMADRVWAEHAVAWVLLRNWRRWLRENPDGLASERLRLANEAAHVRPVETAELPKRARAGRVAVSPPGFTLPPRRSYEDSAASKARTRPEGVR